jgi:hypothetical protein
VDFLLDMVIFIRKFHVVTAYVGGLWQLLRLLIIFLTPEERRRTLQICVSINVHGRRVPGLIFALEVSYMAELWTVDRQQLV